MATETLNNYPIEQHRVDQFTANVQAALYKQGGLLFPYFSPGSYTGDKSQVVDYIGPVEFIERDTVYQDSKFTEAEHTQRWITGRDFDVNMLIDRIDRIRMLYDPANPYVNAIRDGANRKMDQLAVQSFFDVARTGKSGATFTVFPAQDVIADGGTRMGVAKLRAARKLLRKRHVDTRSERPYICVTAEQIDDLLGEVAVGSSDYNSVKPLVDGDVSSFMGFTFIPYEDATQGVYNLTGGGDINGLPVRKNGSNYIRQCPVFVQSGMHFGTWQGFNLTVAPNPSKNFIPQIHADFSCGATRIQEGKVLKLECLEV